MSEDRRCGIFWRRHIENSRSFVWGSEIESESVVMHRLTEAVHSEKKSDANFADPMGWPRRRQPSVSSTGIVSCWMDGWGLFENFFIVSLMEFPNAMYEMQR